MSKKTLRQIVCPILAAIIWGTAFVAQSVSTDYIGAFTFNAIRSFIGALVLVPVIVLLRKFGKKEERTQEEKKAYAKKLIVGGICCGLALAVASFLQQAGLSDTSAGKAGFITALYIVLVPIFGIALKKKAPVSVWISVVIALAGLYLLCIKEDFTVNVSDLLVLLCAVGFTVHILVIDHFTQFVSGVELSCVQFLVAGIVSSICMFIFEKPVASDIIVCWFPLLYVGVFSSGVAYTLQIIAQKGSNPTVVSLLLSLESVFATVSGALILGDVMTQKEYLGCGLMFIAVMLAQIPPEAFKRKKKA